MDAGLTEDDVNFCTYISKCLAWTYRRGGGERYAEHTTKHCELSFKRLVYMYIYRSIYLSIHKSFSTLFLYLNLQHFSPPTLHPHLPKCKVLTPSHPSPPTPSSVQTPNTTETAPHSTNIPTPSSPPHSPKSSNSPPLPPESTPSFSESAANTRASE